MIITEERRQQLIDLIGNVLAAHAQYGGDADEEEIYRLALAALEAKPGLWELIESGESTFFSPHPPTDHDEVDTVWYTAPPVPVMKPIEPPPTGCLGWVKEAIHEHDNKWIAAIRAAGYEVKE